MWSHIDIYFRKFVISVLLLTTVLLSAGNVLAEHHDELEGWSTSLGAGAWFFETDEEVETGQLYELKVGYDIDPDWTIEGSFAGLPFLNKNNPPDDRFQIDHDTWGLKYSVEGLYHLTDSGNWDPFAAAGVGLLWHKENFEDGYYDVFGAVGGGANYFLDQNWAVRGDYRLAMVGHDTEWNHSALVSIGYHFGGTKRALGSGSGTMSAEDPGVSGLGVVYYDFDSAELQAPAKMTLDKNAEWLKSNPETAIILEGHCDERGTNEYNLALGERRAQSAVNYLSSKGVAKERLTTISYGEEWPADAGHTEAAWAKNRRVESKARK